MFCPKCGDELTDVRGELTCVRGNMGVSQNMERRLSEYFTLRQWTAREDNVLATSQTWFCPAHGTLMKQEETGIARCPRCQLIINPFIYELTEFHPHARFDVSSDIH